MSHERDRDIGEVVRSERPRLSEFIRRRVPDAADAEDIVQEVFHELVEANRLLVPIEHVTGWLYRVARNRIIDLFRRRRPTAATAGGAGGEGSGDASLDDLLPSPDAGPEALHARALLIEELAEAVADLPPDQRDVFVAHEIEGRSFRELSEATGVSVNTLLSRKHYAVRRLRARLQDAYDAYREEGGL
ncbi:MAG: sigma-70 family RNA polymerase sigma factor [Candidatus Eisenbacteria bacterium]